METFVQLINQVGFPIAVAIFMGYMNLKMQDTISKLSDTIGDLKTSIDEIKIFIKGEN